MKKTPRKDVGSRRVPSQERSRERVSRIVVAAAHEFAEKGIEAATMEGIAERAETSVGSIYQFYPNKRALYEALANRYHDEVRALFSLFASDDMARAGSSAPTWQHVIGAAIDAFAELHRTSIVARAVWTNFLYSQQFWEAGEAINRDFAARTAVMLERFALASKRSALQKLPAARRKLMATVLIETISVLLLRSINLPPAQAVAMLEEAKLISCRYLEPYLA